MRHWAQLVQMLVIGRGQGDCDGFMASGDMIGLTQAPPSLTVAWDSRGKMVWMFRCA